MQAKNKIIFTILGLVLASFIFYGGFYYGSSLSKDHLKNPTSQELTNFLAGDKTNEKQQVDFQYDPVDFARELRENANEAGYRAAVVVVFLKAFPFYVNAFETQDKGLIYIDPQTDKQVTLKTGERYWQQNDFDLPWPQGDIVTNVYAPIW